MTNITLGARHIADTLGVTTLDLAHFLQNAAAKLMNDAARIVKNDPWHHWHDEEGQAAELRDLAGRAENLMRAAFECERAYDEDNPIDDDEDGEAA